jgi:hypothetical protein
MGSPHTGLRVVASLQLHTTATKRGATGKGSEVTEGVRSVVSIGKVLEKTGAEWIIGKLNLFPNPMGFTQYFDRDPNSLILVDLTHNHFFRKLTATCVYTFMCQKREQPATHFPNC